MDALLSSSLLSSNSAPHKINFSSARIENEPKVYRTNLSNFPKPSKKSKSRLQPSKPLDYNGTHLTSQKKSWIITQKSYYTPSLLSKLINTLEDIINKYIDPPKRACVDPRIVLSRNFAPVDELPPTECEIDEGALPSSLEGAYIRNGPNPQFYPRGPYHLFDGDGMVHCIRIRDGKATLCSRFVKTYKYKIEHDAGFSIIPNVFSGVNGFFGFMARVSLAVARVAAGQFNPSNGVGLANTSVAFFGDRLYALGESDLPYAVRLTPDRDIQTLGRNDFDGKLVLSMTAHPKVDHDTGETFAYRYGPIPPFLTYFRFDAKGNVNADVPISSLTRPPFIHDFAITKKYTIFPDIQIVMDITSMILRGGSLLNWDPSKVSRIGIIPRYDNDEKNIRWFDVPGFNAVHVINAWDDIDEYGNESIVMVAANILSAQHTLQRMDLTHSSIEKIKIDPKTGVVSRQTLSARNLDFGVVNPTYTGKKNRYVYAAVGDPAPNVTGVVKLDVSRAENPGCPDCVVGSRDFGPGCYGGEPFFVARDPENVDADEDDGYVVSYVHDENIGVSKFIVMDAKSLRLDIVASVRLPQRVPYGFHGLFVKDKDLKRL
ncbi:hypothetical protein RND81_08G147300 [Saponaria officinalis]|uniref:Carotenoid cleavage dioxygenase 4 n=1 Tax=Saponaria officinalis TaxID=3572 RepID=A0AAW1JAX6_SAPOF